MAEYETLARTHMATQVAQVAVIQTALGAYWENLMDADDLDGSFQRFESTALRIIAAGRTRSESTAQAYYAAVKAEADLGPTVAVPRQPLEAPRIATSLGATGLAFTKRQIANGFTPAAALAMGQASMLRSAKRLTLDAGRQRLMGLSGKDPDILGWARVSDGNPCYFCAMLVSRGPVYTEAGGNFGAHDGCGCSVRPVPKNDPSEGWTQGARDLQARFQEVGAGGDLNAWRKAYSSSE